VIARRFLFPTHGDLSIDAYPAIAELNPEFADACREKLTDLRLYAELDRGDAVTRRVLAEIYADTVILGSADPRLAGLDRDGWVSWLVENEPVFAFLREATWAREAFEDPDGDARPV
jgi:hypothetical protein